MQAARILRLGFQFRTGRWDPEEVGANPPRHRHLALPLPARGARGFLCQWGAGRVCGAPQHRAAEGEAKIPRVWPHSRGWELGGYLIVFAYLFMYLLMYLLIYSCIYYLFMYLLFIHVFIIYSCIYYLFMYFLFIHVFIIHSCIYYSFMYLLFIHVFIHVLYIYLCICSGPNWS